MTTPLWRSRPTAFEMLPATTVRREQINDFIYLSQGNSNSYLVVTADGRVVINTGMGFEAPVHKEYYDSIDRSPVRYILLTQGHVDHVGGVDLFLEEGTEVVAQANNAAQQAYDERLANFRAQRSYFAFADSIERAIAYTLEQTGGKGPALHPGCRCDLVMSHIPSVQAEVDALTEEQRQELRDAIARDEAARR